MKIQFKPSITNRQPLSGNQDPIKTSPHRQAKPADLQGVGCSHPGKPRAHGRNALRTASSSCCLLACMLVCGVPSPCSLTDLQVFAGFNVITAVTAFRFNQRQIAHVLIFAFQESTTTGTFLYNLSNTVRQKKIRNPKKYECLLENVQSQKATAFVGTCLITDHIKPTKKPSIPVKACSNSDHSCIGGGWWDIKPLSRICIAKRPLQKKRSRGISKTFEMS